MFDLSQVAEGLKSVVPPVDHLSFTYDEIHRILDCLFFYLDSIPPEDSDYDSIRQEVCKIIDYFKSYAYH